MRVGRYLAFILVAVVGSVTLSSLSELPRDLISVIVAIVAVAGLELVESRITRASNATFRELAETINEVFWLSSPDFSSFSYVSPAYDRWTGYSRKEIYDDAGCWLRHVHADDRDRVAAFIRGPERTPQCELKLVHRDGSVRIIEVQTFPIRDEHGVTVRLAGSARDVTEQHQLAEQVRQTQKLESLGLLAGGIAHDFNNILAVIGSNNSLLAEIITNPEDRELVTDIEDAVHRATSLTRQLLAFSRKQATHPVVLDLNALISDTHKMLRRMVGEEVSIGTSLEPELAAVRMDPGHLVQILMNLAVNARDAMPDGGSLTLTTRTAGDRVVMLVSDTGTGMPPDVMARVFEPFFTTKDPTKGTGLGLSVVHGIVEEAGGHIAIASEPGKGTTFEINLPGLAEREGAAEVGVELASEGRETILFVDDDLYVRISAARALRAQGYTVLEADNGREALDLLAREPGISLLVTDIVMPGMDGRVLAERARISNPDLRVIFSTGYTEDAVLKHGIRRAEVELIEKPFRARELASKIREVLDAA
ncbi:MAG: ATP-binding protein [Kofleriaceae bacterium]